MQEHLKRGGEVLRLGALSVILLLTGGVCAADGAPRVAVVNKGFPGRNTLNALTLLDKEVLPVKAQHAVVYFGMNDAMNSANLQPLPAFRTNLLTIVKRLRENGARTVALVTLNPVIEAYVRERHPKHPQRDRLQDYLATYDRAVRDLAAELKLPLVDLREVVERNGGTAVSSACLIRCEANSGGKDGVHLTSAGYARLGEKVFETLGPLVKPGETVVCFGDSLTYGAGAKGAGQSAEGESYPAVLQRSFDGRQ